MITLCPHCGHSLKHPVHDGITSCRNCNRVFDSSPFNRILSAGWIARRQNLIGPEKLIQHGYDPEEAKMAIEFVVEKCMSHQEFVEVLKNLGISTQYICVDRAG